HRRCSRDDGVVTQAPCKVASPGFHLSACWSVDKGYAKNSAGQYSSDVRQSIDLSGIWVRRRELSEIDIPIPQLSRSVLTPRPHRSVRLKYQCMFATGRGSQSLHALNSGWCRMRIIVTCPEPELAPIVRAPDPNTRIICQSYDMGTAD